MARQFIHENNVVPASYLARSDETEQAWLERLDAVGTTPVLREPFDGDPNTHDPGEAVETMTDGWLVISYPNPIAKLPVWQTSTREQMYILPDADVPPGYTDVEPPLLCSWDEIAKIWVPDIAVMQSAIRAERDRLLTACDWTQLKDTPCSEAQQTAWESYRQDLRDIPSQAEFPWDGDVELTPWPVLPE
jgi:hypothetical protein